MIKIILSFVSGFILSLVIAAWIALSFTHLNNFNVLKAYNYSYTTIKGQHPEHSKENYLKDVSLEISILSCRLFKTSQKEAKWFGFHLKESDELVTNSLNNIGAVNSAADITEYCNKLQENVLNQLTASSH